MYTNEIKKPKIRPNSSQKRSNIIDKNGLKDLENFNSKKRPKSKKLEDKNMRGQLLNTNMSIAINNYSSENQEIQYRVKYKKIYPELLLNNPKRFIEIVNDNCFHLEMNLKLLGFEDEFIKESQQINNMTASHNPFLK